MNTCWLQIEKAFKTDFNAHKYQNIIYIEMHLLKKFHEKSISFFLEKV